MQSIELSLDLRPKSVIDSEHNASEQRVQERDTLGSMLHGKWAQWSDARRLIEEEWLKDLRAFNQQNEPEASKLSKYHAHIYIGLSRTKAMSAYARIVDIMFQSGDTHWGIEPTPVPASAIEINPELGNLADEMARRAELMEDEIEDKMIDLDYEGHVKGAILEGCILGSGVVKGVIPGIKTEEKWDYVEYIDDEGMLVQDWDLAFKEIPSPQISSPSIFDIYPDPYASSVRDMSGIFERHLLNRQQFADLRDDPRFDSVKIDEILQQSDKGNHAPLYHETERRAIAKLQDATATVAERYEVLEYWGQVPGRMLQSAGVEEAEETETYWANVWTCSGKTLLAKIMPMKRQRIPYNFFIYQRVPHQFWGVGPVRMMRHTQLTLNGSIRSLLDGMAMAAIPQCEVNVHMLKAGQDPSKQYPGQVWLRDSGDPSVAAVRFFQPSVPTGQLMQMADMFKRYADDETSLPAYTYGDMSQEITKTAQGMSMLMGSSEKPIKAVIKNLEDGCIKPLVQSWFDWVMQWSDRDEIKGDMNIKVLGTSAIMAKELRSQNMMTFLNMTANPLDISKVDREYLLREVARSLEIDPEKAIPDTPEEEQMTQPEQAQPSIVDEARAELYKAQTMKEQAMIDRIIAETANKNVQTQYSAVQTAAQAITNPAIIPTSDTLLASAGYVDHDDPPVAQMPESGAMAIDTGVPQNTSPAFPPVAQEPDAVVQPGQSGPDEMSAIPGSPMSGIETQEFDH